MQHGQIHGRLPVRQRPNRGVGTPIPSRRTADEIEVNLGSLDAPDQLMPTYESWIVRRESWLPPFPLTKRYERDREAMGRS